MNDLEGASASDLFGNDVAIGTSVYGPAIIVGAPHVGDNIGAAYTYRLISGTWKLQQTLEPAEGEGGNFGETVTIDDEYCAVSAPRQYNIMKSALYAGAAYVFIYRGVIWSQQIKLKGLIRDAQFGSSIDIKGDLLVIGAPYAVNFSGYSAAAHIYERIGSNWSEIDILSLSNAQGYDNRSYFSVAVAVDNDQLFISVPGGHLTHGFSGEDQYDKASHVLFYKRNKLGKFYLSKMIHDNELVISSFNNSIIWQCR